MKNNKIALIITIVVPLFAVMLILGINIWFKNDESASSDNSEKDNLSQETTTGDGTTNYRESKVGFFSLFLPEDVRLKPFSEEDNDYRAVMSSAEENGEVVARVHLVDQTKILEDISNTPKFPALHKILNLYMTPQFGELTNAEVMADAQYETMSGIVRIRKGYESNEIVRNDRVYIVGAYGQYLMIYEEEKNVVDWERVLHTTYVKANFDETDKVIMKDYYNKFLKIGFSYRYDGVQYIWQEGNKLHLAEGLNSINTIEVISKSSGETVASVISSVITDNKSNCKPVQSNTLPYELPEGYQYWYNSRQKECGTHNHFSDNMYGLAFFLYNPAVSDKVYYISIGNGGEFDSVPSEDYQTWVESIVIKEE